jgi:hypothetical protein
VCVLHVRMLALNKASVKRYRRCDAMAQQVHAWPWSGAVGDGSAWAPGRREHRGRVCQVGGPVCAVRLSVLRSVKRRMRQGRRRFSRRLQGGPGTLGGSVGTYGRKEARGLRVFEIFGNEKHLKASQGL